MIVCVASLLALIVAGYFPVRLLTGDRYAPVLAAPIATALMCTIAGMVCLVLQVSMVVAVVLVGLFSTACAVLVVRGRGTSDAAPDRRRAGARVDTPAVFWLLLGGVIPFFTVLRAPIGWDARSILWFHAKWWAEGGGALVDAMRTPAFVFSHADYPPLASATIGALWALFGGRSLEQAQFVTAVLGLSAATILGYAVWRLFAGRLPGVVVVATAALLIAACYGLVGVDAGTNGYVDFLWSVAFAAAAVFLLASPRSEAALRWGSLMLAASMLTKNEALIAGVLLAALAVVRFRFGRRPLVWIAAAVAPGVVWVLLTRVVGAYSDAIDQYRTSELMHLDHEVTSRIVPSLHAVTDHLVYVAAATALVTALGVGLGFVAAARRAVSGSIIPWMWIAWGLITVPLVLAYVVSNYDLAWHLATSIDRTTTAPNLVLLAELTIWTLTFLMAPDDDERLRPGSAGRETAAHQPLV